MKKQMETHLNKEVKVLVLSRKRHEKITIGDDITIAIVEIRGDKVRIGIEAPADIPVHREEVHRKIQAELARLAQSES